MINFNDRKTKRIIASVIFILVVIALLVPMVLAYLV